MSIDIDKERAAFEDWIKREAFNIPSATLTEQYAWDAWQARAATPQATEQAVHQVKHHGDGKEWTDVGPERFEKFAEAGFDTRTLYVTPRAPTPAAAEGQAEAARENLALVIARLEQIVATEGEFNENLVDWAKEALPCANALAAPLPRQAAVQGEWISVADRLPLPAPLPNGDTQVILALWKRGALADNLSSAMTSNVIYFMQNVANFTHWMPLPAAPQIAPDQARSAPTTTEKDKS